MFELETREFHLTKTRSPTQVQVTETNSEYAVCSSCNPGTYSDTEDAMICMDCQEGFVQKNSFQTQCEACPVNYAALTKGMTACEKCPWGKSTNEQTGSKDCSECTFFYKYSEHCDFPVVGVILGIILLFIVSYGVYFAYVVFEREAREF